MFDNPIGEAGKQEIFATNVPKILDLKSSSEQIFIRKLSLGAPAVVPSVGTEAQIRYNETINPPGEPKCLVPLFLL